MAESNKIMEQGAQAPVAPAAPTPEAPKAPEAVDTQALVLQGNNPLWVKFSGQIGFEIKTQGVNGSKSTSIALASPKAIATKLGVTIKSENVRLTRQARATAIKQHIASEIGKHSVNPNIQGLNERITSGKNGRRITYTLFEPKNTSADDEFFASELGLSVDEVRKMRQAQAAKKAVIDVDGKVIPSTPATPATTTEMPK